MNLFVTKIVYQNIWWLFCTD